LKSRIHLLFVGVLLLWGLLIVRAAVLQVWPNHRLNALQARQFQTVITLSNRRGVIVDRNNRELAMSTTAYSIYADPKLIDTKKATAKKIAGILGDSVSAIFNKIKNPQKRFVWLERLTDKEHADKIKSLNMRGLQIVEEYKRIYPNEGLLAHSLGFVGTEGQGLEGLELAYNQELQGDKKKVLVRRDARGRPLVADGLMFAENPDGAEVKLTVDADLQHELESEVQTAMTDYDADSAMAIILDAKTSAILAMGSAPSFDPNVGSRASSENRRNRILTDAFEPGSTLKTFVVAGALHNKILQPNTKYNTENGRFKVGDRIIKEAEMHEKWPQLTASEILAYSSNVGAAKIAFDLGGERLAKSLAEFGFGQKTGIDLPGDSKGIIKPLPWTPISLATISFGQGIAVTALQMANAYAAVANGGVLNTPYMVQSIRDSETGETKEFGPKMVRRVLTPEESASMRMMLTGVTSWGSGANARVDGFLVGGKTGTAQKVDPNGRGYIKGGYISSFAGFIPATDPKFVVYVVVDHPRKNNAYYGAQVAAPIFSRLASYAARRAGLAPVILSEKNLVDQNMMKKMSASTNVKIAKKMAKNFKNGKSRLPAQAKNLKNPVLPASDVMTSADVVTNATAAIPVPQIEYVPELKDLTLREVYRRIGGQDLQVQVRGQGIVSEVIPTAGSLLPASRKIWVILKPLSSAEAVSR
jgi:cell division protein FtsI (penicillin-binding protein 3)